MSIYLIGGDRGGPPFNRRFFRDIIGEICEKCETKDGSGTQQLLLFLTDGATLEVSHIQDLGDQYMTLQATPSGGGEDSIHVIPYGGIYRVQILPKGSGDERVGFRWEALRRKPRTGRGGRRKPSQASDDRE